MNKTLVLLASVAAISFSAPLFAAEKETSETKTEKTDDAGTTTVSKSKEKTSVDSKGNVDKSVKTEESSDPKGLFNKTSTKTKDTSETKSDGTVKTTHKKVVDGKTVEDTTETTK